MRFVTVTTYAERHWGLYAERCILSYRDKWPWDVPLVAYEDVELYSRVAWLREFKARHAHRPTANYRLDAVRFAHKVAAIELAAMHPVAGYEADVLIWMDADCVTHAPVDKAWLSALLGDGDFAYLPRRAKYPECGFMMFRLASESARELIRDVSQLYKTDALFRLREWHDSYAIEHCRARINGLRCVSLSGNAGHTSHPLINGPLGARIDHLKGKRKAAGRSSARDLRVKRAEVYWR